MDKSTRWSFTAYEGQYSIIDAHAAQPHELIAEIGWQDEICPKTQKKHRQGYVRTVRQVRFSQLSAIMPGIHLEVAKNWQALINYCQKVESRDPSGNQVQVKFQRPMRLHEMLIEVARNMNNDCKRLGESLSSLDRQTDRRILLRYLRDYSHDLVRAHPEYAVVLTRQDARDSWCEFIEVWLEKGWEPASGGQ